MSLWAHSPFAARPLSPALERFVGCLAATPYQWYLRPDGKLRARENGTEMCAVTGVARYRMGRLYSVGDWIHAGESVGLSAFEAGLVVAAADAGRAGGAVRRLRRRMLSAALERRPPREAPARGTAVTPLEERAVVSRCAA